MKRHRALLALAGGALAMTTLLAAACGIDLDGYAGDPLTSDTGTAEATPDATDAPEDSALADAGAETGADSGCPTGRGPTMIRVTDQNAKFCIDATEVTNGQYQAFLASGASPSNTPQLAACAFNTTFAAGAGSAVDDPTKASYPVVVIDWCDAYAFCKWAGKRLCGKVGGGQSSTADFGTTKNEFYFACSRGGTQPYPYGGADSPQACNATGDKSLEPVANRATCIGGYPGIYDLVGNVGEWQDDCDTQDGGDDHCPDNSSSFTYVSGPLDVVQRCDHHDDQVRSQAYVDLGFRCCAD